MKIRLYNVSPKIPAELEFLETLSRNIWWCWNANALQLFRRIDAKAWRESDHNPCRFLARVPQKRLEALAEDKSFLGHQDEVKASYDAHVVQAGREKAETHGAKCVAYFSLEYGIHESVRIYSGGLGVLAGDHLKAASDLNIPLVAVGLLYRQGYFRQYLNNDDWQQESYPEHEIHHLPVHKACGADGKQVEVGVLMPNGELRALVWRLDVGNVPLYLLDTNTPDNQPEYRSVTAQLYGGDREMRLRQELLLGIGGFRALLALGLDPHVCHMNEGHAAFLSLARLAHFAGIEGLDMSVAMEIVPRTTVFTTHTPVPAGNETFKIELLRPYLEAIGGDVGISAEQVIQWGRKSGDDEKPELSMTILGLRMAQRSNGVSKLHGSVSRRMWAHLWPGRPQDEIPIGHVTNGIHVSSWLAHDHAALYGRYLGPGWEEHPAEDQVTLNVKQIPDDDLWRVHELGRSHLIRSVRQFAEKQLRKRNATRAEVAAAESVLDHDVLTIGFARRFAGYKRAALVLKDHERLEALLCDKDRAIQIIFAGKAHPADRHGKELIQQIVRFAQRADAQRHIVFVEDYDINIARHLVQGVDVWLNTPQRPREASGTSGMKAAMNGALNVSILDGWWCEGYSRECGWSIGHGENYEDEEYRDSVESQALYNVLENEVIPCFYERPDGDMPRAWVKMMKSSIRMGLGFFTSHRMVDEYRTLSYDPAMKDYEGLMAGKARRARKLATQRKRLSSLWSKVKVVSMSSTNEGDTLHVGETFDVSARVQLGELRPEEVDVQVYCGPVDSQNNITRSHVERMKMVQDLGEGVHLYERRIRCGRAGRYGFSTRVTPHGRDWKNTVPGFITWADGA